MSKTIINVDDLTIGDLEDIEEIAGAPAGTVFAKDFEAKTLKALVYVARRREDPSIELDDCRDIRFGDIDITDDDEIAKAAAKDGDTGPSDDGGASES